MNNRIVFPVINDVSNTGGLRVNVTSIANENPIAGARVRITSENQPDNIIEDLITSEIGQTQIVELPAPPLELSMQPFAEKPYSEYNMEVVADGFETIYISSIEILPGVLAIQNVRMQPRVSDNTAETFVIPDHTLYAEYPPKIAEDEIKDISQTGEIVLSRVVIPEYVVVHDGPPSDSSANNYYVRYRDYIKNVASSEIYATWPEAAIQANVLAIMSFTLNRVYTEWYRNKGYNFTITTSTAYDQKWISGRNVFESISRVVDTIFTNYLSRPGVLQPLFTQYCDGKRVSCPGWMTQWGSKNLADQGYTAIEILRNYYGQDIYINTSTEVSGIPSSWPGYNLTIGSSGDKIRQLQRQLNVISNAYPLIPKVIEDGIYGSSTENAVSVFQDVFDLASTGITDFPTWYKISEIYVGVSKIAESIY